MTSSATSPLESFVTKIERRRPLPSAARVALLDVPATMLTAQANEIVIKEKAQATRCLFVRSGFVSRQKTVKHSSQIIGVGVPGDAVDLQSLWFEFSDHDVVSHTRSVLIAVQHEDIAALCARFSILARTLWHDCLVDAAIFREWTLNIGHRRATCRLAHFFLEIATRFAANGSIRDDIFDLPMTQGDIASALGLSLVHTNKSLKQLKDKRLIAISGRRVELLDRAALEREANFDPAYLHFKSEPRMLETLATREAHPEEPRFTPTI